MMKITIQLAVTLVLLMFSTVALSQQIIKGTVTDENGDALPGVSVLIKGTSTGGVTDIDGNYSFGGSENAEILVFSFIGYNTVEVPITGRSVIDYQMKLNITQLSEVVVTAFGIKQERKKLGYAVQEINAEEITETNQPNLINSLQGRVAGVQINSSGGGAGAGSNIIIRGITSLSPGADNQPLFVVDGIPISNQTASGNVLPSAGSNAVSSAEQFSNTNRAADINPDDIASMSILKGASATALYGLRAANGVVLITTKKGQSGKMRVDLTSSVSADNVVTFPGVQTRFREGREGSIRTNSDGSQSSTRFQTLGPAYAESDIVYDPFQDFFQTGYKFNNSINISGGSDNTTYYTSISNLSQTGVVPNSDWSRTSVKLSGSTALSSKLSVNGSMNYSMSGGNRAQGGDKSIMSTLNYFSPTYDVNDYINPDGTQNSFAGTIIDNPRYLAEFSTYEDNVRRTISYFGADYEPLDWLSFSYKVGIDAYSDVRTRIAPPLIDITFSNGGFIVEENINYQEVNSNFLAILNHSFTEDFSATFTLGNQVTDISSSQISTRGENFTLPDFYDLSNASNFFTSKNDFTRRIVGIFADLQLDYKNSVFLGITGRNDWSSTLPEENRSFFYPSVSLSYVFSETFELPTFFTFGKIRASFAQVGKDASPYQVGSYFQNTPGSPFLGQNAFRLDDVAGSLDLKPETTQSIEFGTDMRFLNNRIGIDFTYFKQNSRDQIIPIPVSNTTSLSRFVTNAGEIENRGVEILLNASPIKQEGFSWDFSVNFTRIRNEVIDIDPRVDEIIFYQDGPAEIVNKLVKGGSAGDLYGHPYLRNEQGQLIISDEGLPQSRLDTLLLVGNALPDFTAGLTNTFNYKGFSLSFLLEWRSGGDLLDVGMRNRIRNGVDKRTERRYEQVIFKGVTADGSVNTTPVNLTGYGNDVNSGFYRGESAYVGSSDILLQDASWFRIRNIGLSYSLPRAILSNTAFNGVRFSISGNNVFLNTPFIGFDPEGSQFGSGSNAFGFNGQNIPNARSFTFKVNLSL